MMDITRTRFDGLLNVRGNRVFIAPAGLSILNLREEGRQHFNVDIFAMRLFRMNCKYRICYPDLDECVSHI